MTKQELQAEALERARSGMSATNYPAIFAGFIAKGIAEADIRPRENVLTFHAWKAVGRSVKKGEHGVKVTTMVPVYDADDPGKVLGTRPTTAVVFHESQTEPTADAEARWAKARENGGGARTWNGRRGRFTPRDRAGQRDRDAWRADPGEQAADAWNATHGDRWSES